MTLKKRLTPAVVNALKPEPAQYRLYDTDQPKLFVRVSPGGAKAFMVTWARNKAVKIGVVGEMTITQARQTAARYLTEAAEHGEPLAVRRRAKGDSLRDFILKVYWPWHESQYRDTKQSLNRLVKRLGDLADKPMNQITHRDVERCRSDWLADKLAPTTVNRLIATLKGVFSRAQEWGELPENPIKKVKAMKVDDRARVRYLSPEEHARLMTALEAREAELRSGRESGNEWRKHRNRELLEPLGYYADHLRPMVVLSLNTGLRRGELFNLKWSDVDLKQKVLTVRGEGAKSLKTRHIPLNEKALTVLEHWPKTGPFVFTSASGEKFDNVKKAWTAILEKAEIKSFRWHDLRHTFASNLVQRGVPLNTVRELLGHADLSMTLRYSHLAPSNLQQAVSML